jgi:hypothetical protein
MRTVTRLAPVLGLVLAATSLAAPSTSDSAGISLRPVKYSDLERTIRGLKGKVVIVDFWADY